MDPLQEDKWRKFVVGATSGGNETSMFIFGKP